jgi:ABC-type sugar transport system permease subunit
VRRALVQRNRFIAYTFLLPNIVGFLVFVLIPVIFAVGISFTNWNGFMRPEFVGLSNYRRLISDSNFRISLANTFIYIFFAVPFTLALSILVAVLVNQKILFQGFTRTALFLPNMAAIVAVAVVWRLILHPDYGPVNAMLRAIGIVDPPRWFGASNSAMASVVIVGIWHNLGYYMVIFLAGLQNIPRQLYESASIDGASAFRKFFSITIPMLTPTVFFASVISIIDSFMVFSLVYVLTRGGPGRATSVLAFTIYDQAFGAYRWGYASAISFVLFFFIFIVTLVQYRGQKKWVHYY